MMRRVLGWGGLVLTSAAALFVALLVYFAVWDAVRAFLFR